MSQFIQVHENVIPKALCEQLIARFEKDRRVRPDPQPDYSTRRYLNLSKCKDWLLLNTQICEIVNDLVAQYFERPKKLMSATHHEWSDDGYVMSCYAPGDACILHVDGQCPVAPQNGLRLCTVILYLNDVPKGGETVFPLQKLKFKPKRGRAIVFPVGFTHPHEVTATKSERYIVQTWITDPKLVVTDASG